MRPKCTFSGCLKCAVSHLHSSVVQLWCEKRNALRVTKWQNKYKTTCAKSAVFCQHSFLALLAATVLLLAVMIFFVFLISLRYKYLLVLAEACGAGVIDFGREKSQVTFTCPLFFLCLTGEPGLTKQVHKHRRGAHYLWLRLKVLWSRLSQRKLVYVALASYYSLSKLPK